MIETAVGRRRLLHGPPPATAGLALVVAIAGTTFLLAGLAPVVSALIWAFALGALLAPAARDAPATRPGVIVASRRLLRVGIALLGLRISLGDIGALGIGGVIIAAGTVTITMLAPVGCARLLKVERELSLLIAAGTPICGALAIAAMDATIRARQEDVGYAVATVTIFGTVAMAGIPLVGLHVLGMAEVTTGLWAGAPIHEVTQVAGAGGAISIAALQAATLMKLTRLLLLGSVVAAAHLLRRDGSSLRGRGVPGFLLAFGGARGGAHRAAAARRGGRCGHGDVDAAPGRGARALGLQVHVAELRSAGPRARCFWACSLR